MLLNQAYGDFELPQSEAKDLEALDGVWGCATVMFGSDICDASPAKQKKARKKLFRVFGETFAELSDEARACFSDDVSDRDIFCHLRAFSQAENARQENIRQSTRQSVDILAHDWDDDTKAAVTDFLLLYEYPFDITCKEGILYYPLQSDLAFDSTLLFLDVWGLPKNAESMPMREVTLTYRNGRYHIKGIFLGAEDESTRPFHLSFSNARVEHTRLQMTWNDQSDTPWDRLISTCAAICAKANLLFPISAPFNERETELLPLLCEIASLDVNSNLDDTLRVSRFPLLSDLLNEYRYKNPYRVLKQLERKAPTSYSFIWTAQKLKNLLNEQKHEALWRELNRKIHASQENYISQTSFYLPELALDAPRKQIETRMHAHGYAGSYPDFVKSGEIRGWHLRSSYGMSYLITPTKHTIFHIHCHESASFETFTIQFLSGTALTKKEETSPDVTDCIFSANGKRFYAITDCNLYFGDTAKEVESDDLDIAIDTAVKKAEMQKLSRAEKKQDESATVGSSILLFLFVLLFMGTLFGFFMTLGFILIEFLTCLFTGLLHEFPELFITTPWWQIGLAAGGLFGISMGIIEVISNRRN